MKKIDFRKSCYCSVVAIASLFAVCSNNLHAANNSGQSLQESTAEIVTQDFTLTPVNDENAFIKSFTDEVIPRGLWNVTKVVFEKSTDAKKDKKTYSNAVDVQSVIPCPLKWEIVSEKELVMYFPDNKTEKLEYILNDGQMMINYLGANYFYHFSFNNNTMTLTAKFLNGNIEEHLIITSKMQNK